MNDTLPASIQVEAVRKFTLAALEQLKALDIHQIDVRPRASFTDYMIFASGSSTRHVSAIADAVIEAAQDQGSPALGVEGAEIGEWVLVDLGDVIVHIMLPDVRRYYELENLWSESDSDN